MMIRQTLSAHYKNQTEIVFNTGRFFKTPRIVMGCNTSVVSISKTTFNTENINNLSEKAYDLSQEDIRIIRKTWKTLSVDIVELGIKVFLNLFKINPATKQVFSYRHLEGEELLKDIRFKGHATRLMQTIEIVVDKIEELSTAIIPLLVDIGKQHYTFEGFHKSFWESCPDAILYTWRAELKERFTAPKYRAWSTVFALIVAKLKEGYDLGGAAITEKFARRPNRVSVI